MLDTVATFRFLAATTTTLRTGVALVPQRKRIDAAKEMCALG